MQELPFDVVAHGVVVIARIGKLRKETRRVVRRVNCVARRVANRREIPVSIEGEGGALPTRGDDSSWRAVPGALDCGHLARRIGHSRQTTGAIIREYRAHHACQRIDRA
jgi:hypothetical protein